MVYEDIYDAKAAVDHLSGFNIGGRYLVVLYYQPASFRNDKKLKTSNRKLSSCGNRFSKKRLH